MTKPRVVNWHIEALEEGQWKPWCRCIDVPKLIPEDADMMLCSTPFMSGPEFLVSRCLDQYGIQAKVVNEPCPVLQEDDNGL